MAVGVAHVKVYALARRRLPRPGDHARCPRRDGRGARAQAGPQHGAQELVDRRAAALPEAPAPGADPKSLETALVSPFEATDEEAPAYYDAGAGRSPRPHMYMLLLLHM